MNVDELGKPLDSRHVKDLAKGGTTVQYIETWHAIAEANRIFGFDGWSRETLDMKCVSDRERKVGSGQGFGVAYTARVRITVGGVSRDGFGAGTQVDRDHGKAHEGASKEAESDATKRALMTFGNVFGLALYDKSRVNVEDVAARERFDMVMAKMKTDLQGLDTVQEITAAYKTLGDDYRGGPEIVALFAARKAEIEAASQARAAELKESKV